jgi:putative ABC transport system substrate-binding protein
LLAACGGPAQPSGKPRKSRVLMFSPGPLAPSGLLGAFQSQMTELGYVEGDSLVLEERHSAGKMEELPTLAAQLANGGWNAIVTSGTQASQAMKAATSSVAIVMTNSTDPVAQGLVASLEKPGGNVTGLHYTSREFTAKRLDLLKLAKPDLTRLMVLWNANNPVDAQQFEAARSAAEKLGIQAQSLELRGNTIDLTAAFEAAGREQAQAMLVVNDPLIFARAADIAKLALQHKLLTMYDRREYLARGGFMAYGANIPQLYRQAAAVVDKVLHGAKPGDLPVEPPAKFDLVVSQATAKALGYTVPQELLSQATEVL